jgi:hypothetical protein
MSCEGCAHWGLTYAPYIHALVNTCDLSKDCENEESCKFYKPKKEARNVLSILQFVQVHTD